MKYNDQKMMISILIGICAFLSLVLGGYDLATEGSWDDTWMNMSPWWPISITLVLIAIRFTVYRKWKK